MAMRILFWRWTGLFAAAGLLLPLCFCVHWFVFRGSGTELEARLWPSSLMFMALDEPTPAATSTVVAVFAIAMIENILLYACVGALLWFLLWIIFRGFARLRARPQ
jgi:hypothetical protein